MRNCSLSLRTSLSSAAAPAHEFVKLRTTYARGRGAYYIKGCLNPQLRGQFARHWYWNLRLLVHQRRFPEAMYEITAGAEYLMRSLVRPRPRHAG